MPDLMQVEIALAFPEADLVYLDRQTRLLRREIESQGLETSVVAVEAPTGTRTGIAEVAGILQLLLLPTLGPKLLDILQVWMTNRKGSVIKLKVVDDNRSVEVEFDPKQTTWRDIDSLVKRTSKHVSHK